jgi:hypothetical protein
MGIRLNCFRSGLPTDGYGSPAMLQESIRGLLMAPIDVMRSGCATPARLSQKRQLGAFHIEWPVIVQFRTRPFSVRMVENVPAGRSNVPSCYQTLSESRVAGQFCPVFHYASPGVRSEDRHSRFGHVGCQTLTSPDFLRQSFW